VTFGNGFFDYHADLEPFPKGIKLDDKITIFET
jgi:hypothetical protein